MLTALCWSLAHGAQGTANLQEGGGMRAKVAWLAGLCLVISVLGCSGTPATPASPSAPPPRNLTGAVTLAQTPRELLGGFASNGSSPIFTLASIKDVGKDGAPCTGAGGYSDLTSGRQVTVFGPKAEVLATVPLGAGTYRIIPADTPSLGPGASIDHIAIVDAYARGKNLLCTFAFEAPGIPQAETLSVEVGSRGRLTFTRAHLEASGWHLDLVFPSL